MEVKTILFRKREKNVHKKRESPMATYENWCYKSIATTNGTPMAWNLHITPTGLIYFVIQCYFAGDFCSNVLQEAMGKEWEIASHPMSARILEQVIPNSNWADGATVRECLASRLTWDHLGCPAHLLETIVRDAGRRVK
ncbi:unnamed protein product, partial [Nesidiocoris tenuis]